MSKFSLKSKQAVVAATTIIATAAIATPAAVLLLKDDDSPHKSKSSDLTLNPRTQEKASISKISFGKPINILESKDVNAFISNGSNQYVAVGDNGKISLFDSKFNVLKIIDSKLLANASFTAIAQDKKVPTNFVVATSDGSVVSIKIASDNEITEVSSVKVFDKGAIRVILPTEDGGFVFAGDGGFVTRVDKSFNLVDLTTKSPFLKVLKNNVGVLASSSDPTTPGGYVATGAFGDIGWFFINEKNVFPFQGKSASNVFGDGSSITAISADQTGYLVGGSKGQIVHLTFNLKIDEKFGSPLKIGDTPIHDIVTLPHSSGFLVLGENGLVKYINSELKIDSKILIDPSVLNGSTITHGKLLDNGNVIIVGDNGLVNIIEISY